MRKQRKYDELLWDQFEERFKRAFVSSTFERSRIHQMETTSHERGTISTNTSPNISLLSANSNGSSDGEISLSNLPKRTPPHSQKELLKWKGCLTPLPCGTAVTPEHHAGWAHEVKLWVTKGNEKPKETNSRNGAYKGELPGKEKRMRS